MADPIVAPDVATTQPNATPAPPDLTPITGAPTQPAPPSNAAVIPGDFTSSGAPQAVPAPNRTNNGGVGAGFASAASPRFAADENGTIKQTNPTPQNFKGLLGSVLGGALRGAAYGMAAEKGESGAVAAQRLNEQAQLQARQQAQQAYENKRQQERDTLNHGLITAQTVSLQQRLAMEQETHKAEMTKLGFENDELLRKHRANDQGEKDALSVAKAELINHGIQAQHNLVPNKSTSTGSAADLKGNTAKSVIAQMTAHAPNIANGKLMPVQNGQDGENSGIDLYSMEDLNKPINKPFYYQLPTGMTNPDGTPVMSDKVITPDGKTSYGDALALIHGANAQLDQENKRLAQIEERKQATLKQQDEALKPALTQSEIGKNKATAAREYAEAAKAKADAAATGGEVMQNTAQRLVDAWEDPSQLSKRSKTYDATIAAADAYSMAKYGKHWDQAQAAIDFGYAHQKSTQDTLKYMGSLVGQHGVGGNLNELVNQSNHIDREDFPSINNVEAWAKLQAGDPAMAGYKTTVLEVADQVAKILQGGGTGNGTSDAKLKQAQDLFNTGFSKDSITTIAKDMQTLLENRATSMVGSNRYLQRQFPDWAVQSGAVVGGGVTNTTGGGTNSNASTGGNRNITPAAQSYLDNR